MEIKIRNDKKRDKSVAYLTDRFAGEATLKASDNKKTARLLLLQLATSHLPSLTEHFYSCNCSERCDLEILLHELGIYG